MVVREAEWTDQDVRDLLNLADVESHSCPGCGWHESFTEDDSNVFEPTDRVCPLCSTKARRERLLSSREAEAYKDTAPEVRRPSDGRYSYFTLLTPEEVQQRKGGAGGDQD